VKHRLCGVRTSREILAALSVEYELGLDEPQVQRLLDFESWLVDEALPAGGIGPNEADRVIERHIVDSLAMGIVARAHHGGRLRGSGLDIGSGAGLPGIPLAIALPEIHFTLLDRSGRRIRLLKRAARVLDLDVDVHQSPVEAIRDRFDLVTSRASLPPDELLPHLRRLVTPGGIGVVGGSATRQVSVDGYRVEEFRSKILGIRRWMLMMRQS